MRGAFLRLLMQEDLNFLLTNRIPRRLATRIVDLVSSGRTLQENGLVEVERIMQVSARLVVNRAAMKTRAHVFPLVEAFRAAVDRARAA